MPFTQNRVLSGAKGGSLWETPAPCTELGSDRPGLPEVQRASGSAVPCSPASPGAFTGQGYTALAVGGCLSPLLQGRKQTQEQRRLSESPCLYLPSSRSGFWVQKPPRCGQGTPCRHSSSSQLGPQGKAAGDCHTGDGDTDPARCNEHAGTRTPRRGPGSCQQRTPPSAATRHPEAGTTGALLP